MRSYCALYVEAGYLLASAATRVTGTSLRGGVTVDHRRLIEALIAQVEKESSAPLLRVNWYDSGRRPGGTPDLVQEEIGMLPRVKLRLGRLSPTGEQKGVDLRIGLDLAAHGRNRVVDLLYLVSGDDDLTEAVDEAQNHGVQVILLAVPSIDGRPHAVSRHLQREADGLLLIDAGVIDLGLSTPQCRPHGRSSQRLRRSRQRPRCHPLHRRHGDAIRPAMPDHAPTPSVLASRSRTSDRPPARASNPTPTGQLVYSSTTGVARGNDTAPHGAHEELIDDVCTSVIEAWRQTATPEERRDLLGSQPYIPRDLDRALLVDLSDRSGVYDVDERTRYQLRGRFWELAGKLLRG